MPDAQAVAGERRVDRAGDSGDRDEHRRGGRLVRRANVGDVRPWNHEDVPRVILAQVEERHRVGVRVDDRGGQTLPTTSQKGQSASSALCITDRWVVGD